MWSSAAGFTVSICVADVRPVALAVIVDDPARVSLYLKVALFDPAMIVTLLIVAVSAALRKMPPDDPVVSETIRQMSRSPRRRSRPASAP